MSSITAAGSHGSRHPITGTGDRSQASGFAVSTARHIAHAGGRLLRLNIEDTMKMHDLILKDPGLCVEFAQEGC